MSTQPDAPEPIAVVGIGCRLPGSANSADALWDLLAAGRDVVGEVPDDRWRDYLAMGPAYAAATRRTPRRGGYLDEDIAWFDNEFFGVTHREAETMDPQHRMMLEVTWEALEHAGIPPLTLAGRQVGVYTGVINDDYGRRLLENLPDLDAWVAIGVANSGAANRVSYALDLRGPSLAVDTACSASLTAVHLACQSLRAGESELALAGGVQLIAAPAWSLSLEAGGFLSPVGLSKAFSGDADGYVRGEGCGVLVLKRLADAERDGDRILSVVLGTSVIHDGRSENFVAPSEAAQQAMARQACAEAGIEPNTVDYVEAHGTGTRRGDRTEVVALSTVYGAGRPADDPCLIGSVKTNIGHLEASAGIAGVIKAVLALGHDHIPPSLHNSSLNPAVDWETAGIKVVTEPTAWPRRSHPRRAAVSSFGFGGTISHVLLQQAPDRRPAAAVPSSTTPNTNTSTVFPLSARSESGLRRNAARLADWLRGPGADTALADVGHTLALRRSHLTHRASVVAADRDELINGLRNIADGELAPGIATGTTDAVPRAVWVFSGHGSQWAGMGRELLNAQPVFAGVIDKIEPVFAEESGFSLREALREGEFAGVGRTQMLIFAMQVALAEVWRAHGAAPDAVIGHSMGEIAAAVVSGACTLEVGARLISRRSGLLWRAEGKGTMATINLPFDEVATKLAGRDDVVAAISSSPRASVISGDVGAVESLVGDWEAAGLLPRRINIQMASHSPAMDPLLADLREAIADLPVGEPLIPMYSTSATDPRSKGVLDGEYWVGNLRRPVRLREAVEAAVADGYGAFLEVAPHPVVGNPISETVSALGREDVFVGLTLRRGHPEHETLMGSIGEAHCHGIDVDLGCLYLEGELATLPSMQWLRQPHWRDFAPSGAVEQANHVVDSHSLLGAATTVAGSSMRLWRTFLDGDNRPYPDSHPINGVEIVPASVLLNTFLGTASGAVPAVLTDVRFRVPLVADGDGKEIQVARDQRLVLAVRDRDAEHWLTCVTASVAPASPHGALPATLPAPPDELSPADPGEIRATLTATGVDGTAFPWEVEKLERTGQLLRVSVRHDLATTWAPMLDAALTVAAHALSDGITPRMLAHVGEVRISGEPVADAVIQAIVDQQRDTVTLLLADRDGTVRARISDVSCAEVGGGRLGSADAADLVHELAWRPVEFSPASNQPTGVVFVGADLLCAPFAAAGLRCTAVSDPGELIDALDATSHVCVLPPLPGSDDEVPHAAGHAADLLLSTARVLAGADLARKPRLWCLTMGVREAESEAHLAHAPLWGAGRIVGAEHPELWGGIVDLNHEDLDSVAPVLTGILSADPREDVISLRQDGLSAARLVPTTREPAGEPVRCRLDGTYLITGGLGGIGLEIAQRLADHGARRIVLAGRRRFPERSTWDRVTDAAVRGRIEWIRALEAQGVTVKVVALDIADAEAAARALAPDALGLPPIRGVVHAAGVLGDRLVDEVDRQALNDALRPKVSGAWTLHRLFPPGSLDFLVLFSSNGYLCSMPGQAMYAAGNAFLDSFATHRRCSGAADTVSIGWSLWRGKGMAGNKVVESELRARGIGDTTAEEALQVWDHIDRCGPGYFAVMRTLPPGDEPRVSLPLLSETMDVQARSEADAGPAEYRHLDPERLHEWLTVEVVKLIAAEMRLHADELDPTASLVTQGLDSVMSLVLRRRLEKRFGQSLPANLLWHKPTAAAIVDHLSGLLSDNVREGAAS
ncbi:6-methylsalicylic acid synthase [Saccharopolyspora erythraea NRRL 2338]|uniref:Iterative type I polyketide synthase n=3 Tax=Saccharopolyspora erythraea TaxID=1836 RepID=A4FKH2_SACEN|nr:type I polyketide synthase [Saccharopolyspora erythraea]PFG98185.1 6-methylsalicylic acid synthase [Saccharopolyspora erythraea NRRL 2338]QRK88285.1 type I polyketide synthase [Saccharopolyspora erythraea]CAM04547.1 iterative type I polyketide synthase [Saccharopolyspora erythraea NRRL 2338]